MIALKGNQKKLRERLLAEIKGVKAQSVHSYKQKSHGRNLCYRVKVWSVSSEERWAGLRRVVSVHRRGNRGKKQVDSVSYYISSEEASAYCFGKWIQGHRRIENNLHWIKDVILKEDSCQISKKQTTLVSANVEGLLGLMSPFSPSNKVFA